MSFLERLQHKPQHVKGQYAFFIALGITGIITAVWTLSLPARFVSMNSELQVKEEGESGFLDTLIGEAESQLGNVAESVEMVQPSNLEALGAENTYGGTYAGVEGDTSEVIISTPVEPEPTVVPPSSAPSIPQSEDKPRPEPQGPRNVIFYSATTSVGQNP